MIGRMFAAIRTRAATLLFAAACAGTAFAQCRYDVTTMQGPNNAVTIAKDVNNLGQVVGYYYHVDDDRGFLWTPDEGFQTLPMPPGGVSFQATAVSDTGIIVGTVETPTLGGYRAFVLSNESYTIIEPLAGGNFTWGEDVNYQGQIAGYWGDSLFGNPGNQAFFFDGQLHDLTPDLGAPGGMARAINDAGAVTGWRGTSASRNGRAFVWRAGTVEILPAIPGGVTSEGRGINSGGDVAGFGWTRDPSTGPAYRHGFAWIHGEMITIDSLPSFTHTLPLSINDNRVVVGYCTGATQRAFLWEGSSTEDLTAKLSPDSGVTMTVAWSINSNGQVAGYGTSSGRTVGLLLTPRVLASDLDGDCTIGLSDLAALLTDFGCVGECLADINRDGETSIEDLALLLGEFGQ